MRENPKAPVLTCICCGETVSFVEFIRHAADFLEVYLCPVGHRTLRMTK